MQNFDLITKMADMSIYGKNPLRIFFSRTRRLMTWDMACNIWDAGPTKFV